MQDILIGVCLEKLTVLSLSEHLFKAVEKEKENIENDSQYYIPRQFILLRKNEFDDQIEEINQLKNEGKSNVEIGKMFGISEAAVRRRIVKHQKRIQE